MCLNFFFAIFIINKIKIIENKTTKIMELSLSKLRSVLTTLLIFFLLKTKNEHISFFIGNILINVRNQ